MSKKILVVEDDDDIRDTLKSALIVLGFQAISASNGKEALAIADQESPCLIFLDLMMPVMNGWQFREKQQADPKLSDIPVVVVSAAGNVMQNAAKIGAVGCLKKPIDFDLFSAFANRFADPQVDLLNAAFLRQQNKTELSD